MIATEDHRFYIHKGIDVIAITRALLHDIQAGKMVLNFIYYSTAGLHIAYKNMTLFFFLT